MITLSPLANFGSAVPWGLWVSIYIWLVGISAGTFAIIMWAQIKNKVHIKQLSAMGIILSLSCLSAGLVSILADLGHMERFYKLFISPNFTSVMACMVWMYNVYAVILLFFLLRLQKGIPKMAFKIGLVFAIGLLLLESLLFAMPPGKLWHSPIFVIHFLVSSLGSGILALIVAVSVFWKKDDKENILKKLGSGALAFVALSLLIEILEIILHSYVGHAFEWLSVLGLIITGFLLMKRAPSGIFTAGIIGLTQVLFSKYNSVISAQVVEPFKGFAKAYIEPRAQFSYVPSVFEIFVSALLVCVAAGMFYYLYKIFPLTRQEKI